MKTVRDRAGTRDLATPASPLPPLRWLLASNSGPNAAAVAEGLRSRGHDVEVVGRSGLGLDRLQGWAPQVVVVDPDQPAESLELLRQRMARDICLERAGVIAAEPNQLVAQTPAGMGISDSPALTALEQNATHALASDAEVRSLALTKPPSFPAAAEHTGVARCLHTLASVPDVYRLRVQADDTEGTVELSGSLVVHAACGSRRARSQRREGVEALAEVLEMRGERSIVQRRLRPEGMSVVLPLDAALRAATDCVNRKRGDAPETTPTLRVHASELLPAAQLAVLQGDAFADHTEAGVHDSITAVAPAPKRLPHPLPASRQAPPPPPSRATAGAPRVGRSTAPITPDSLLFGEPHFADDEPPTIPLGTLEAPSLPELYAQGTNPAGTPTTPLASHNLNGRRPSATTPTYIGPAPSDAGDLAGVTTAPRSLPKLAQWATLGVAACGLACGLAFLWPAPKGGIASGAAVSSKAPAAELTEPDRARAPVVAAPAASAQVPTTPAPISETVTTTAAEAEPPASVPRSWARSRELSDRAQSAGPTRARLLLRDALRFDPRNPHALSGMAKFALRAGDAGRAVKYAKRAVEVRRGRRQYRLLLARALSEAGMKAEAAEQFSIAKKLRRGR